MTISDSALYTTVWTAVRNKLVAKAPFVTNSKTAATTVASINAQYKDSASNLKPQIIIHPIDKDEREFKFGSAEGKKFINVIIDCYSGNSLGIDQLGEQVEECLKLNDIPGIDLIGIVSNNALSIANETKWYLKSITFTYDRE